MSVHACPNCECGSRESLRARAVTLRGSGHSSYGVRQRRPAREGISLMLIGKGSQVRQPQVMT